MIPPNDPDWDALVLRSKAAKSRPAAWLEMAAVYGDLGQDVLYITERCVIRLGAKGLVATEIMPGIDPVRDIMAASGGRVQIAPDAITLPLSLLADAPMGWGK